MRRLAALVVLAVLVAPARAQEAGPGETEVYREGSFVVYSDDATLTKERARKVVAVMKEAWLFVKEQQHWKDEKVLEHDLGLHVLTEARMKETSKLGGGAPVPAMTRGANAIAMVEGLLAKEDSKQVLAHELLHIQDLRHLAVNKRVRELPSYAKEGRAIAMGRAFAVKSGVDQSRTDERLVATLGAMSVAEARKTLAEDAHVPEKDMDRSGYKLAHMLGFFFFEWVRTREGGVADLQARLARVVEGVSGGASFEEAWKTEVGEGLEATQKAFFEHLAATAGKPGERFKGTVLEKAVKPEGKGEGKPPQAPEARPPQDTPK